MIERVRRCGGEHFELLRIDVNTEAYSPYANTNGQWIARNVISGFFTAPIEALPEITVTDVVCLMVQSIRTILDNCSTSHTSEALTWASTPFSLLVVTSLRP